MWGEEYIHEVQYLRVYIGQLRNRLEQKPNRPSLIVTVSRIWYRLCTDI